VAWTCHDLGIESLADDEVAVVAGEAGAIVVTTNRNFIPPARRLRVCPVVHLRVTEVHARTAMERALRWFETPANKLGAGFVLRVPKVAELSVLPPVPWS
jgi:hypothetical protein